MSSPYDRGMHPPLIVDAAAPGAQGAEASPASRPESGQGVHATWIYTLVSLLAFVVLFAVGIVSMTVRRVEDWDATAWLFTMLVALTAFAGCRFCFWMRAGIGAGLPGRRLVLLLVLPAMLAWGISLTAPGYALVGAIPLWLATTCLCVLVARGPRKRVLIVGVLLLGMHPVLVMLIHDVSLEDIGVASFRALGVALYLLVLPLVFIGSIWWWNVVVRLDASRHASSQLAVTRERLRFAADLHDIQGHHLQVIALKTELAGRLMQSQPAAARQQIDEAQDLARTALEDTRALVHGYRQVDFSDEVRNAADVLDAAGIACRVAVDDSGLEPTVQKALGLVIREATTNILRHSEATSASFALETDGSYWNLEITNDGVGPTAGTQSGDGTGLSGLRRRLSEVGGSLEVINSVQRFRLVADVPVQGGGAA